MTKPVAYIYNYANGDYALWHKTEQHIEKAIPLYTKEQLHPCVKMTQVEFDEFKILKSLNPTSDLIAILKTVSNFKYKNLQSRFVCGSIENQTEFATLWLRCRYERLEETIEIVPDMKWFVRSKELAKNSKYLWLCDAEYLDVPQCLFTNDNQLSAMGFDTKEEAEKWTNPLTEAVQLPVEGE
ncbi:hypothetical protein [Leuconostoc mesenteroides]|uniref:hypothetical protein n=1 Tax=Leuconostoc mesenteroides TaxID=1245 RepID=UPI002360DFE2|nr:hypothetical protein [Leuconostoc mesenteroides]